MYNKKIDFENKRQIYNFKLILLDLFFILKFQGSKIKNKK